MVNISKSELEALERVDYGCFGTIYRKDDKVYKVYHEKVKNDFKEPVDNPLLDFPFLTIHKLNRLIRLNSSIKYTDLTEDILYVDNKFAGMVMPYYEGELFANLKDLPLEERIRLLRELLRNAKELTESGIYLFDQRLKNVMLVNGEVKIIDTDDYYVKAPFIKNPYYFFKSIYSLDSTCKSFLGEFVRSTHREVITSKVSRKFYRNTYSYKALEEYLDFKSIPYRILFIDDEFDIDSDKLISGSRVLLVYDKLDIPHILETINKLDQRCITVYDVVSREDMRAYMNNIAHDECLFVEHNRVLTLK